MENNQKKSIEEKTMDYQRINEQLESLSSQKDRFSMQKAEYKNAETEITNAKGKIYSAVGSVIVEVSKEDASKTIKEKIEMVDLRLSVITKQIAELSEKEKKARAELENMLKPAPS